jgi:hypothetical protein
MTNTRRSASRTTPRSMTSSQLNLKPYDPACARCAPRSKHLAAKSDVKCAENARPAVQFSRKLPSATTQAGLRAALKRINKELERHQLGSPNSPCRSGPTGSCPVPSREFHSLSPAGATASEGMAPHPSRRRKTIIEGAKIGRISQATKIAQAVRDSQYVASLDLPADNDIAICIDAMNLKDRLGVSRPIVVIVCMDSSSESWEP